MVFKADNFKKMDSHSDKSFNYKIELPDTTPVVISIKLDFLQRDRVNSDARVLQKEKK